MKIEIVYFSGTGNTWWVVEKLKGALEEKGHEVRMVAYESKERNHLPTENAELFGIAFPTYVGSVLNGAQHRIL
jgi:flavodoxin